MKLSNKMSKLGKLNRIVLAVYFLSGGPVWSMMVRGVTARLILPIIGVNALLAIVYYISRKKGGLRKPLIILRCAAVLVTSVIYIAPVIGLGFNHNKVLYPVKRAVFGYGVRSGRNMEFFLPKKLPDECDSYYFRTQLIFPAQDYHPGAYLAFHCDEKYFSEYIDFAERNGFEKQTREESLDEYISKYIGNAESIEDIGDDSMPEVIARYVGIPLYAFYAVREEHRSMLTTDSEMYHNNDAGVSCVFDKTSGLMLFWD